ncbi:MAG: hypothetical protein J2P21_27335 [Chloracidobacterium sp.]|nr:hypothetical protein [Chloracidobacterium sp.]
MNFRSKQYLRYSAMLFTMMLMACAANAQTDEIVKGDHLGIGFKPFSDASVVNNKDCVITVNVNIPTDYSTRSLIAQSQSDKIPQDQAPSDPQKTDPQKTDPQITDPQKKDKEKEDDPSKVNRITGIGHVSSDDYKPLTGKGRFNLFLNQTFVPPEAFLGVAFSAAVDLINHDPPEWKLGAEGYGRRFASRFGTNFLQDSIVALGAAALHEEPRYISSSRKGFFHRSEHALFFTLVTYTNSGKLTPAFAQIGSTYAASMLSTYWLPKRYSPLGDGVRDANLQMGFNGAFNLIEEFWPEIKGITRVFKH